ncbi:MAG: type VI secretion system-associated protein TagF [Betaproteobacteria bacterium]
MTKELEIGWFGKLPSSGDFGFRRLPRALLDDLDDWLRLGLTELRGSMPHDWKEVFTSAPTWNCAIPACVAGGNTLIGVLAPSHDRVGREFPLCAGVVLPGSTAAIQLLAEAHGWLDTLGRIVIEARDHSLPLEDFDTSVRAIALPRPRAHAISSGGGEDILGVLGAGPVDVPTVPMPLAHALPWPELPMMFDAGNPTCFWWTHPGPGTPLRGFTSDIGLTPSLFVTLMRPLVPRKRIAS